MTGCLHKLIEARASASPSAVALDSPGRLVTYRELDGAANHVARFLGRAGVKPRRTVALYGSAGPEMVTAMVGILKAGAAFVPLDPTEPLERTNAILDIAQPAALLTVPDWLARAERLGQQVHVLAPALFETPEEPPKVTVNVRDVAYVLFTSGPTGPAGVVVEHRSIVNYCRWVATANRVLGQVSPLPAITPFVLDASLQQLIAPLVRGDAVWLVPEETRTDPEWLLHVLRSRPGAGLHCLPELWAEVLPLLEKNPAGRPGPASLFLGGDMVGEELWERTCRLLPATARANVYGPAEATVQATGGFQGPEWTVGRPVNGVRIDIRDPDGTPVARGIEGEVYIGGLGVARGYLGDRDLTAARFLDEPGNRYFRTGDAGVLLPDGSLRILGQLDDRSTVHGHRVEPGEIEAVLTAHPDVRAAAVAGTDELCAAVAVVRNNPRLVDELRDEVARRLPQYMRPDRWAVLPELPVTVDVDRRRVAKEFAEAASGERPLRTDTERLVADIWSEVLDCEIVSADADFFEQGGHSLLAVRAGARLKRATGNTSALRLVFDRRTVAGVAAALDADAGEAPAGTDAAFTVEPSGLSAPLSVQQQSVWAAEVALSDTPFNTVFVPLVLTGALDPAVLATALDDVVAAQPSLRTTIDTTGDEPVQSHAPAVDVDLSVVDLRGADHGWRLARKEATELYMRPFDLRNGPVLRARLLLLEDERSMLLLCLHHLVCDGVSVQIMVQDLAAAYLARAQGRPSPLKPVPEYGEFARAQRTDLRLGRYAADLEYWRTKANLSAADLGLDGGGEFRYGIRRVTLDSAISGALRDYAATAGATPFMCLAATLAGLFRLRHGVDQVALGTLAANREVPEYDRVIGFFATTLVLRIDASGQASYHDLVSRARAESLESFARQRVPLDLAVTDGRNPFQVGISWEPDRPLRTAGGLRFELYTGDEDSSLLPVMPSSAAVTFTVRELPAGYRVSCEYNESALSPQDAEDLLAGLASLLDRQLHAPHTPLADLAAQEVAQ